MASSLAAAASSLIDKMHLARHAFHRERGEESEELTKQTLQVLYILLQVGTSHPCRMLPPKMSAPTHCTRPKLFMTNHPISAISPPLNPSRRLCVWASTGYHWRRGFRHMSVLRL